jgi:hypothetical protein
MIIYDKFTILSSNRTFTILGVEYITTKFNTNLRKNIHVITIYKPATTIFNIHKSTSKAFEPNVNVLSNHNNG